MLQQKGFTIVELIAVIMIIGIMSSVAAPKFIGNDAFDVRGAHGTLLASLQLAQKTAIAQRTTVYANIDTATRVICVSYSANCTAPFVTDPATKADYSKTLPASVSITTSLTSIPFNGRGLVGTTDTTLTVQNNASSNARTITIEADTGYVH
jgi:MSHA pilin protein MshC